MRRILGWWLLGGLLTTPVWADISLGGSPSAGMGGAGLAVIRRPTALAFQNPAVAAYIGRPRAAGNFDFSSRGASVNSLLDDLEIRQGSAANIGTTAGLLRSYARQDTQLQVTGDLGVIVSGVVISVGGIVDARLLPNEPLRTWARTDGNPLNIPANARADLIAVSVVSLPDVAAAVRLPAEQGDLAVGVRLRNLKFYYTHYVANQAQLQAGGAATRAPELQGRDFLERSTLGVDLGFLWRPTGDRTYTLALVVENLIEPNIRFQATNRDGQVFNFKPLKRTYNAAVAIELETGSLIAVDFIDVGNSAGKGEIRLGYEQRLTRGLALRAGYASQTGWTAGLGIGGFNIAYSDRLPVVVSRTLNF
ncbi:MAG: conjugal transfer protein TraF [Fimbriimonadales bacterium]|nr:conjugal transfer protein TraF [Fimbriimonadales bacterium]